MRIGLLGGGVIARLFLEELRAGAIPEAEIVALAGRSAGSRGEALAAEFGVPYVVGPAALAATRPDVVIEAASHEAIREYAERLLDQRVSLMILSGGALADDALRERLEHAARANRAVLYVPSGGIGGLDAVKAACAGGAEEVRITVNKPPAAWKGIPYVERLGIDLDRLASATTLFEGSAREGVPHFPANVNIAAALSLAGAGFDRTRLKVVADPALRFNTHDIHVRGRTGTIDLRFQNTTCPDNPRTTLLACFSVVAAARQMATPVRYGT
jgi:aspartate dehydrogenase